MDPIQIFAGIGAVVLLAAAALMHLADRKN